MYMKSLRNLQKISFVGLLLLIIQQISWGQCDVGNTYLSDGAGTQIRLASANTTAYQLCEGKTYTLTLTDGASPGPGPNPDPRFITWNNEIINVTTPTGGITGQTTNTAVSSISFEINPTGSQGTIEFYADGAATATGSKPCIFRFDNITAPVAAFTVPAFVCIGSGDDLILDGSCTGGCGATRSYTWAAENLTTPGALAGTQSTVTHSNDQFRIADASLANSSSYRVSVTVTNTVTADQDHLGIGCTDLDVKTFETRLTPALEPLNFDVTKATTIDNLSMCFDGAAESAIIECTNCGANPVDYTWTYQLMTGPNAASMVTTTYPGSAGANITTGEHIFSDINPDADYAPANGSPELYPGTYTIVASADMNGCENSTAGTLTVNDKPAVHAYWRTSDGGNLYGSAGGSRDYFFDDGGNICGGTEIELLGASCASTKPNSGSRTDRWDPSPSQSSQNLSGNTGHPSSSIVANKPNRVGSEYDCPCVNNCTSSSTGSEYASTTWTSTSSTGTSLATIDDAAARETLSNILIDPTSASEIITYTLTVVGANGCTNSDDIIITATNAPIAFNLPANSNTSATGSVASGTTVPICISNTTATISGHCGATTLDDCYDFGASNPVHAWSKISGPLTFTGATDNMSMETSALANNVGTTTQYQLKIEDEYGCTGYADISIEVTELTPDFGTTDIDVCPNTGIYFINSNHNIGEYYDIHTATPVTNGNRIKTDADHTDIPPSGGTGVYLDISGSTAGSVTYYVRTKDKTGNPTCEAETPITFTVRDTVVLNSSIPTNSNSPDLCMPTNFWFSFDGDFEINGTGGSGGLSYSWTPTGFDGYTFGWGGLNEFFISPSQTNSLPISGASLLVEVSDNYCTSSFDWANIDIGVCGIPILEKRKTPSFTTFDKYLCPGEGLRLNIDWGASTSIPADVTYSWSTGSTGTIAAYPTGTITADSTFTSVTITTAGKNYVLHDTSVMSGPPIDIYPIADTSTCLNETILAQAKCPTCYGDVIEYTWDGNTSPITYSETGSGWDYYIVTPTGGPGATHVLTLEISHGEGCVSTVTKNLLINDLPNPSLRQQSGAPITGPIYLCDGETEILYIDNTSCITCGSYSWNTTATNDSIIVSSQGGYFAEVVDGNSCLGVTDVALIIDAHTGLNSPIVATPDQICSGRHVELEVMPCVGCSYTWHNTSGALAAMPSPIPEHVYRTDLIGDYYAIVTNAENCSYNTAQLNISATTLTIPSIAGTTDSLCSGDVAILSTPFIVNAGYQWYESGNIISGAIDTIYETYTSGDFTVAVTYPNGCIEESRIFNVYAVTFKPNIVAIDTVVCSRTTADLYTDLEPGWQYQWFNDGVPITGANGSIYSATTFGSHYVEVTTNYNCIIRSDSIGITTSSLPVPNATTSTPTLCPGELGNVSVSLCQSCSYQWFSATTGLAITIDATTNYRYDSISVTGGYYAIVSSDEGCSEYSDTVELVVNPVFTPAINSSSNVVCNGRDALLITPSCVGCSYSWLKDGIPSLGALNDTFHLITSISDTGNYQIAVDYPNGCSDTSATLTINDGSYDVLLEIDPSGLVDSVICNGIGETLLATPTENRPGTYLHTLFLNNTPVTGYSSVTSGSAFNTFPGNDLGVYTVGVENPLGCLATSNILPLRSVDFQVVLSSRATSDPSSVTTTAICTPTGRVYLEVDVTPICSNCTYEWRKGGAVIIPDGTVTSYTTDEGVAGTGLYIVEVTDDGCTASSSPVSIANSVGTLNSDANTTDTSICNGQSVTLEHAASAGDPSTNCPGCSFRWLRTLNPINGASNYQFTTSTLGFYNLEVTTSDGCVDTSSIINIRQVDPPAGLTLDFDSLVLIGATLATGTPLASNGDSIDMNNWIFPSYARHDSLDLTYSSYFTSAPFNGALSANAGLHGTDSINFQPEDSLSGYHLITYYYDTLGCTFTAEDVLEVKPPAAISVTNLNPVSVAYEACVGDVLVINTVNLDFAVDEVFVFDVNDNYQLITPLNSVTSSSDTFGVNVRWNTTVNLTVQGDAYASYLMLVGPNLVTGARDTTYTSFVLIHNTDLSFTGLPNMLCSNGEGITLFGSPTGGSFYAESVSGTSISGAFVVDTLYPQQFTQAAYVDGSQQVDIYYSYRETYTNGQLCPEEDTVSIRKEVKDVRLTDVQFNTISVSQTKELLTNLVKGTTPYAARANKQPLYTSSFSGSFTNPAGSPTHFLPANAGIGTHALTYTIQSGDCINSAEDSIIVGPAPTPIPIPDTICRNYGTTLFAREGLVFPYVAPSTSYPPNTIVASYTDESNIISVTGAGVLAGNTNAGSETYSYDPTLVTGNYDTLVIEYRFYRDEDTLDIMGVPIDFDTLEYVVAQIKKPIYIEDLIAVDIIDTIVSPFYCQENTLHLLAGNPSSNAFGGGLFMLYGGTNQYQFGDTLPNSVINPYDVNHLENATTTYDLVYVLNGAACNNSDTMSVTIGRGLNPAFATANGLDEFCDTDPYVLITHNVLSPDTAIWTIGGVPQPSYVFNPDPLDPGIHVVELQQLYTYIQATDTFVCSASAIDTFTIHGLPLLTVVPPLDDQYCANDAIVDLVVGPTPSCPVYTAPGHVLLDEKFDNGGIQPSWNSTFNISGKNWEITTLSPLGGTGNGNAAFIDTSQVLNDSWLITKPLDLVAGHTYRLTYMVLAGELDPTCSGICDAQLSVRLGDVATPAMISTLVPLSTISNDQAYVRYTVEHKHDPLLGYTTGQYYIGFRSVTPALGRSLMLENVRMRDMTLGNCSLEGIGYMTGPGIHHENDSLYQFNPLAVTAGDIDIKYIYTNVKGCQDSLVFPVTVDTAPIVSFTDLPPTYCENEPTLLITGSPLGGEFTSTMGANLVPVGLAVLDTADFPVNYQTNIDGLDIVSYRFEDNNLCSETVHDTITIVRLLDSMYIPASTLDPFGEGHCVNADSTILTIDLASGTFIGDGTFYGSGIRNGAGGLGVATFYPDSAEIDMGHTGDVTVEYIYTTTTGCADTTQFTTRVHALPDLTFMNLPDSICLNVDSFQVVVINNVVGGSMGQLMYPDTLINNAGQFIATDTNGTQLPNFIQLFDTLYPYTADGYSQVHVSYNYTSSAAFGACFSEINDSVRIDTIPEVHFQDLNTYYCENEPASIFLAFPAFSVGSGYLLIDSTQIDSSFFWIDPAVMVGPGLTTAVYPTYYTFTDTRGCRGEAYDTFEVRPYPRITFSPTAQDTFCRQVGLYDLRQLLLAPIGGYFTDNLALTSIQDSFFLNLNSLAGPRLVTYHYTDPVTQCQNDSSIWLYIFNSPDIDFTIYGGCADMDITFDGVANNLEAGIDSITRIWWDFEGNGTITNSHLDTSAITIPDTTYLYGSSGIYNVTLNIENQGGCPASITKPLIVSPYHDLVADYFEDFNGGAGNWYDDQINVTPNNIWTHESSLASNFINNSDGFWVTMAADTLYDVNQSAWVYSPCFDFSASKRPMIAFDLWRDVLPGIDGAVLEFYNNTTNDWELVGNVGEGINWYQSDFILGRPGNQLNSTFPSGWTGRSNGVESARLRLDRFKGDRDIRFRIAFATSSQTVIDSLSGNGYEGVAFDNVWIGERTRNVLVEHFDHVDYVNGSSLASSTINGSVYNKIFNSVNGLDVILIQYQTEAQGLVMDPLFSTNTADLGSRQYQYSAEPNNIFVDGRTIGDGLSESLNQLDLDYDMLQFPDFTIEVDTPVTIVNGVLSTSATVTALVEKDSSTIYTTRVAVIQDSFTYVGSSHMLSVFRKMLPNNGGTRKSDGWQVGEQQFIAQSLTLSTLGQQVPVNETQLEVVVFIQDANDNVRDVYQAATTQDLNRYTGTTKLEDDMATEIFALNVYPNPSSDLFNVEFDKALEGAYNWRLVDVTGRVLQTGTTATGTEKFTINAERLVDGAYFFIINSDDNRAYAQRKLIVIK